MRKRKYSTIAGAVPVSKDKKRAVIHNFLQSTFSRVDGKGRWFDFGVNLSDIWVSQFV